MQRIILKGRLGKDAELVSFGERQSLKFSLAADYGRGEKVVTTWYDIIYSRIPLQQYLTKGKEVLVTGRLDVRKSEGKDGKTYVNLTVYADELEFLSKGNSGYSQNQGYQQNQNYQPRQQAAPAPQPAPQPVAQEDDGLPF